MRRTILVLLSLAALAGCGERKPKAPQPATANGLAPAEAPKDDGAPSSSSSSSLFAGSCPQAPSKAEVETGLKNAMVAIYGPDESTMRFSVTAMKQQGDCKTYKVDYKSAGSPGTTTMSYADDKWSLTLFNKPYAVP